MEYDDNGQVLNFLSGMVCGAVIGATVALLMAPESGKKTRRKIHRAAGDLRHNATDRWEDLTEDVKDRVDEAMRGARKRLS